eukprot:scaffold6894_cov104-Isochrysis_galbana.AAC.4
MEPASTSQNCSSASATRASPACFEPAAHAGHTTSASSRYWLRERVPANISKDVLKRESSCTRGETSTRLPAAPPASLLHPPLGALTPPLRAPFRSRLASPLHRWVAPRSTAWVTSPWGEPPCRCPTWRWSEVASTRSCARRRQGGQEASPGMMGHRRVSRAEGAAD